MTDLVTTYAPGSWVLASSTTGWLLADIDPTDPTVLSCWALLRSSAPLGAVLDVLLARGLASVPGFALVHLLPSGEVTVVVRGTAAVLVSGKQASSVTAEGVSTWREALIPVGWHQLALTGADGSDAPAMAMATGLTLANSLCIVDPAAAPDPVPVSGNDAAIPVEEAEPAEGDGSGESAGSAEQVVPGTGSTPPDHDGSAGVGLAAASVGAGVLVGAATTIGLTRDASPGQPSAVVDQVDALTSVPPVSPTVDDGWSVAHESDSTGAESPAADESSTDDASSPEAPAPDAPLEDALAADTAASDAPDASAASPDTVSPDAMSPDAVSPDTVSPDTVSPDAVSPDTAVAADSADAESTDTQSAGTQSAGTQSAGTQSAGTQSAGTQSADPGPTDAPSSTPDRPISETLDSETPDPATPDPADPAAEVSEPGTGAAATALRSVVSDTPPAAPSMAEFSEVPAVSGAPIDQPTATEMIPVMASERDAAPPVPEVDTVRCERDHLNPLTTGICRVCGMALQSQIPRRLPRPQLGVLRMSNGEVIPLDRDVVFGRNPTSEAAGVGPEAHLVSLDSPGQDMSRTHAAIHLEGWTALLADLNSMNGTVVTPPWQEPIRLRPNEPITIEPGTVVNLANEVTFRYEPTG